MNFDFVGKRKIFFTISIVLVIVAIFTTLVIKRNKSLKQEAK